MQSIEIKAAAPSDAGLIGRIHTESWKAAYKGIVPQKYLSNLYPGHWEGPVAGRLESGELMGLIAYYNGEAAGCATFGPARDESYKGFGELVSIYLKPGFMRRGIGSKLMDVSVALMRNRGLWPVYLWVFEDNINARAFYEKLGFVRSSGKCYLTIAGKRLAEIRYVRTV